jgi:plasmid stability protein
MVARGIVFNAFNDHNSFMAQLTVRKVPDQTVKALRIRAARHGRSAEAEHRLILEQALAGSVEEDFWSRADDLRRHIKRQRTDSGVLQRQMRDQR